ncbi:unnamed protein product [Amoebophrya sp. A25]|nr:unnamed protein product [Amoebophrya sp. A25]|eukprot:GSA25T00003527001.1
MKVDNIQFVWAEDYWKRTKPGSSNFSQVKMKHTTEQEKQEHGSSFNEALWRMLPLVRTARPDDLLHRQKPEELEPEMNKFLSNAAMLFFSWAREREKQAGSVNEVREEKAVEARQKTRPHAHAEKVLTRHLKNAQGKAISLRKQLGEPITLSDQDTEAERRRAALTFKSGVLRIYLQDYYSFTSSTFAANMLLHLAPAVWTDEAFAVGSALRFRPQFLPSVEEMADEKGRWYNRTAVVGRSKKQVEAMKKNASSEGESQVAVEEGEQPSSTETISSPSTSNNEAALQPLVRVLGSERDLTSLRHKDQSPSNFRNILPPKTVEMGEKCAYVMLRRRIFLPGDELPMRIPKFRGRHRHGFRTFTSEEIEQVHKAGEEADSIFSLSADLRKNLNAIAQGALAEKPTATTARESTVTQHQGAGVTSSSTKDDTPKTEGGPADDINFIAKSAYVSMTSCSRIGRGTNPYANQECVQFVPLLHFVRTVAEVVAALLKGNKDQKQQRPCAALNLNLYRKSAFSDLKSYSETELVTLENWMTQAANEQVGNFFPHDDPVTFHIFRKPYRDLGPRFEATINLALFHLATKSPLFISEVGTFWGDAVLLERMTGCRYGQRALSPISSPAATEANCRPGAVLEANGTRIARPVWHFSQENLLPESCGLVRGRCTPKGRIWNGFYH